MRSTIFSVITVAATCSLAQGLLTDWKNALPFRRTLTEAQIGQLIAVRLVKKDFLPVGVSIPGNAKVLPRYRGSTETAFDIFKNNETMYEFIERPLHSATELMTQEHGYDNNMETIVIIHTISGDSENPFIRNTVYAFAMRNMVKNYNVFTLHMPSLQGSMEQTIVRSIWAGYANYNAVSKVIGDFFNEAIKQGLVSVEKINLIGFCYSSQLAGYIARHISQQNNGQKINSILGLDPYSMVMSSARYQHVSESDARTVHLFHTNSMAYGTHFRRGFADIVFNNGNMQPGCLYTTNYMCSHRRAVMLLWYIILYSGRFQARQCNSFLQFFTCRCQKHETRALSYPLDPELKGRYFLKTTKHKPYGLGVNGADCHFKVPKVDKHEEDIDLTRSVTF